MFESELRISLYKAMEIGETHRNKHSSLRYLLYSTFWIRLKFQEDCFKSDIATIAWEGHLKLCLLLFLIYFWFILSFAFHCHSEPFQILQNMNSAISKVLNIELPTQDEISKTTVQILFYPFPCIQRSLL